MAFDSLSLMKTMQQLIHIHIFQLLELNTQPSHYSRTRRAPFKRQSDADASPCAQGHKHIPHYIADYAKMANISCLFPLKKFLHRTWHQEVEREKIDNSYESLKKCLSFSRPELPASGQVLDSRDGLTESIHADYLDAATPVAAGGWRRPTVAVTLTSVLPLIMCS